jgi:hypothetical protein
MPHHYMKKGAEGLSVRYPKLIHVSVTDALHSICETICVLHPNVDKLVTNRKKIFGNRQLEQTENNAPDTPLPATPISTQRRTWLNAAVYYAEIAPFRNYKQDMN